MKIEHIAVWVKDLEEMRAFYETYFEAQANELYTNEKKGFSSYFLSFKDGARLEIMTKKEISTASVGGLGLAHFAISLGSKEKVDRLTEQLRVDGFEIVGNPRTTGDGYYESVTKDPEGNLIELTV